MVSQCHCTLTDCLSFVVENTATLLEIHVQFCLWYIENFSQVYNQSFTFLDCWWSFSSISLTRVCRPELLIPRITFVVIKDTHMTLYRPLFRPLTLLKPLPGQKLNSDLFYFVWKFFAVPDAPLHMLASSMLNNGAVSISWWYSLILVLWMIWGSIHYQSSFLFQYLKHWFCLSHSWIAQYLHRLILDVYLSLFVTLK